MESLTLFLFSLFLSDVEQFLDNRHCSYIKFNVTDIEECVSETFDSALCKTPWNIST